MMSGMGRGMFGGGPRRGGGDNAGGGGGGGRGPGGQSSPEADALQKAIDAKAPKAEVKAALEKSIASRKAKQAELEKLLRTTCVKCSPRARKRSPHSMVCSE